MLLYKRGISSLSFLGRNSNSLHNIVLNILFYIKVKKKHCQEMQTALKLIVLYCGFFFFSPSPAALETGTALNMFQLSNLNSIS